MTEEVKLHCELEIWGHSRYRQQYSDIPCVLFSFLSRFLTFCLVLDDSCEKSLSSKIVFLSPVVSSKPIAMSVQLGLFFFLCVSFFPFFSKKKFICHSIAWAH